MENKQNMLIPVSIIIAGLIIAGAIVGKDFLPKNKAETAKESSTVKTSTTAPAQAPQTAVDKFKEYAIELGLNAEQFNSCLDSGRYNGRVDETSKEANALSVNGTPTFFINGKLLVGAQPFQIFKAVLDKELGITTDYPADIKEDMDSLKNSNYFSETVKDIPLSDKDPIKGEAGAPVTIVEFTDYQCPFCSRHTMEVLPQIQTEYIDTGKVSYVIKDVPLTSLGHKNAPKAAEATHCAAEQEKYWEMHNKIFETQSAWSVL